MHISLTGFAWCMLFNSYSICSYVEVTAQKYAAPLVVANTATSHTDSCIFYNVGDFAQKRL